MFYLNIAPIVNLHIGINQELKFVPLKKKLNARSGLIGLLIMISEKRCTKCGIIKPLDEYYLLKSNKADGHRYKCKDCEKEYKRTHKENHKRYYQRHKEQILKRNKEYCLINHDAKVVYFRNYYINNKNEIREKEKIYRGIHKEERKEYYNNYYNGNREQELKRGKHYRDTHKESTKDRIKRYTLNLKSDVLSHYGNGKLVCTKCGYDKDISALTIDHINGGGRKHRESLDTTKFYSWLKNNNYPKGFTTLCQNCQWLKRDEQYEYTKRDISIRHDYHKKYRQSYKVDVLTHYGDGKLACVKCGFSDIRALSIDHINGGGNKHKKENGIKSNIYVWLKKNGYPKGFQTLCMSCQWEKRENNKELEKH
jgi:hypothetical protein